MVLDPNDAADPLQPGNPFKRKNFNKFAFGMMLFMVVFGALIVVYFLFFAHRHVADPATHSTHSEWMLPPSLSLPRCGDRMRRQDAGEICMAFVPIPVQTRSVLHRSFAMEDGRSALEVCPSCAMKMRMTGIQCVV